MKYTKHNHHAAPSWGGFLFSLIVAPILSLGAELPNERFPFGPPEAPEVRITNELRPGLTHIEITHSGAYSSDGVVTLAKNSISLHIIKLDPKIYRGKIVSAWAERGWLTSPYELALRDNAVVAANASFYEFSNDEIPGITSGLSIVNGVWHHEHDGWPLDDGHPFLAIENTDEGPKLSIEYTPPPRPYIKWGNKSIQIDGIDRSPKPGKSEIVVMRSSLVHKSQLSHGTVNKLFKTTSTNEAFSGQHYNIIASGEKEKILQEAIDSGEPIELDLSIPGRPGLNVFFAMPALIINEETPEVNNTAFDPRTSVGADSEGNIYLIAMGWITLRELQSIGKFLGLTNLYNLDGGWGSTSLVIEKQIVGDPKRQFYNEDRRVADSILIIDSE